jgi:hypothetical protein
VCTRTGRGIAWGSFTLVLHIHLSQSIMITVSHYGSQHRQDLQDPRSWADNVELCPSSFRTSYSWSSRWMRASDKAHTGSITSGSFRPPPSISTHPPFSPPPPSPPLLPAPVTAPMAASGSVSRRSLRVSLTPTDRSVTSAGGKHGLSCTHCRDGMLTP